MRYNLEGGTFLSKDLRNTFREKKLYKYFCEILFYAREIHHQVFIIIIIMIIIIITIIIINIPRCETLPESALCKEGLWEVSLLSQVIIIITIINIVIIMKHCHDYHHHHHQLMIDRVSTFCCCTAAEKSKEPRFANYRNNYFHSGSIWNPSTKKIIKSIPGTCCMDGVVNVESATLQNTKKLKGM